MLALSLMFFSWMDIVSLLVESLQSCLPAWYKALSLVVDTQAHTLYRLLYVLSQ
jgi:hypothetical protein